jgi:hypothetical protein
VKIASPVWRSASSMGAGPRRWMPDMLASSPTCSVEGLMDDLARSMEPAWTWPRGRRAGQRRLLRIFPSSLCWCWRSWARITSGPPVSA